MSKRKGNPFHHSVRSVLEQLPPDLLISISSSPVESLLRTLPKTYSIYEPMLLLPAQTLRADPWPRLLSQMTSDQTTAFYESIAKAMRVTHIAANSPISPTFPSHANGGTTSPDHENIQRRPNVRPLHGSFGSYISQPPTPSELAQALWVSARQNGITQIWAPLYTMFSRGNITEKARLLCLPSVVSLTDEGGNWTAVDLFAGIGYFAFSYAKAGAATVLGFELNPWSVEGFRRGAEENGWRCRVVGKVEDFMWDHGLDTRLVVYQMSNMHAASVVEDARDRMPPVRQVNLGLLPTSSGAYEVAVRCLDPDLGGWLHVHENFAVAEIEYLSERLRRTFAQLVGDGKQVVLEHVERVKTYAPGVMHCVMDLRVERNM